jgi:hypothetical protein
MKVGDLCLLFLKKKSVMYSTSFFIFGYSTKFNIKFCSKQIIDKKFSVYLSQRKLATQSSFSQRSASSTTAATKQLIL